MPYYGEYNLTQYLNKNGYFIHEVDVLKLGLKIFDALRLVHKAGYVYSDLKEDNIMMGGSMSDS